MLKNSWKKVIGIRCAIVALNQISHRSVPSGEHSWQQYRVLSPLMSPSQMMQPPRQPPTTCSRHQAISLSLDFEIHMDFWAYCRDWLAVYGCSIDMHYRLNNHRLRWGASNVTQPWNNWRHGFRFIALERPSRSCRGHPWRHAICLVPKLFLGLFWPCSELSTTLYVLHTMTMPTANLSEIPCYFSVRLKNQLNNFCRNGLRIQLLH